VTVSLSSMRHLLGCLQPPWVTSGFAQGGLGAATSDGGTRLTIERDQQVHESIGRDGKIMRSGLTESTDGTKYLNLSRRRPRVDSDACLRDNRQPNAVIIAMRRAAVCVLLVAALRAPTDARAVDLRNVLTGYALASWTEGEGRSLGEVSAIVQDVSGYLWLGTNTGLIRFDGWRFRRWETISREPLPRSPIVALRVSHDGVLWVLFTDGAVRQIKDNKVLAAPPANGDGGPVFNLSEDHNGTMWTVSNGTVRRFRGGRWEKVEFKSGSAPASAVMVRAVGAHVWISGQIGLYKWIEESDSFQKVLDIGALDVAEDAGQRLWMTDFNHGFRSVAAPLLSRT